MGYLLDTVTIIRFFSDFGKIGNKAKEILNSDKNSFVISVISLMEILYLSEKKRINIGLSETIEILKASDKYTLADLTPDIIEVAEQVHFYELHDRLIIATAKWLDIPIISSDKKLLEIDDVKVIWD
ncbi:MAG: type II toxin-antitoxin system VapC family toxin [Spirochaetes bacterium]|nr:type II toxin-antitoxin system VapC family toxin [Spirochaetota bacterium]